MPPALPVIFRCSMQRMTFRSRNVAARRTAAAVTCNSSLAFGKMQSHSQLISFTQLQTLLPPRRSNAYSSIIALRSQSFLLSRFGICISAKNSFVLPPACRTNDSRILLKRGFVNDSKKSDFVGSKVDNTLKSLRELRTYVKTQLSLDIWAFNIILMAFVFGPSIWAAMKEAPDRNDDYAFSIPVDDPVEHSVRILMECTGNNEQEADQMSIPNVKSRKSGIKEKTATTIISPEEDAKRILNDLLGSENVRATASRVASNVIQSPPFQNAVKALVKNVWNDMINDPETSSQLTSLIQSVLQNQRIYGAVKDLLLQLINDDEVYDELTKLVVQLGEERDVLKATQKLLTESAHATLNDPDVLDHSMEFATAVVGDDVVQRTGGEALRNSVGYAVQPTGGAVMVGISTMVLAGVLHLYFSRGSNTGLSNNGSGSYISLSDKTHPLLSQPSSPSLETSSFRGWAQLFQNAHELIRTAMMKVSSFNSAVATVCSSGWCFIYSFSSTIGKSALTIYNFILSNTLHWFSVGASTLRHIVLMWYNKSSLSSNT